MTYLHKICDPIHGFIRFGSHERKVIDSVAFQRLRYIRQMGVAYLVYPGALHTRFEHSLGVMDLATRMYNILMTRFTGVKDIDYWRLILRLAALCHDLGHLPFSHTAEKALLPEGGHEKKTLEIIQSAELRAIWQGIGAHAEKDIIKLSLSEKELEDFNTNLVLTPWERALSQIITEDNFGADRIDYLIRDANSTGVGYGHFDYHQLIDTLRLIEVNGTLVLGIESSGIQSVESLWIARYMMYARVYQHPKCRVYTNHMRRFMTFFYASGVPSSLDAYLEQRDYTILAALGAAAKSGNEDAACLLKLKGAFQDIPLGEINEAALVARLKDLEDTFGAHVLVDYSPKQMPKRDFYVFSEDGKMTSSSEASPFLSTIPKGEKGLRLYGHPDHASRVCQWIKKFT